MADVFTLIFKNVATGEKIIKNVYAASEIYKGPYIDNAPDLLVGYYSGYRASWDSVVGKISHDNIMEENRKRWSGDHCIDPEEVPGIIYSNRKLQIDNPGIIDLAPSILKLLGVPIPSYMDGSPFVSDSQA